MSCVWFPFSSKLANKFTFLRYNPKDHTLLIVNGSSGAYISRVELDLHKDTLSVNVYKRLIFIKPTSIINSAPTNWKIKLNSNVSFVRLGTELTPLSKLQKYPVEEYIYIYYPAIEIYPQKFPYVGK
jgi:hypothetical protein